MVVRLDEVILLVKIDCEFLHPTLDMWKKFDFFTSELLQSDSPTSSLFAIQVFMILRLLLVCRQWILHVLRVAMDNSCLRTRREVLLCRIRIIR